MDGRDWGKIAPHRVQRDACQLCFLGGDSLFAAVVAAFLTHVMRTLHGLTLRALLNDDRRRTLRSVAKTFALLRITAFGDGHGTTRAEVRLEMGQTRGCATTHPIDGQSSPARTYTSQRLNQYHR